MSISVVASVGAGGTQYGVTSSSLDTTGADLLICVASWYYAVNSTDTMSDSKGNTWTALTLSGTTTSRCRIFYSTNSPTVGSGHTFTFSPGGSGAGYAIYPSINVLAVSGAHATSPFDQQNTNSGSGTSLSTGSVTPTENSELLIAGIVRGQANSASIDGGFTISSQVNYNGGMNMGGALAYLIQSTAAAANPSFSRISNDSLSRTVIATFKAASPGGGGGSILPFMNFYLRV